MFKQAVALQTQFLSSEATIAAVIVKDRYVRF